MRAQLFNSDSLEMLSQLESESVQCVVTSPPYWFLANYGFDEQIGVEETPELYVDRLADVFDEVKRVLRPDGLLFLNIATRTTEVEGVVAISQRADCEKHTGRTDNQGKNTNTSRWGIWLGFLGSWQQNYKKEAGTCVPIAFGTKHSRTLNPFFPAQEKLMSTYSC